MFFCGDFSIVSPASLLQMLAHEQRSVTILARRGQQSAAVTLVEGLVVAAQCGDLTGRLAVEHWLVWDAGQFRLELLESTPESVEMMAPGEELVLDAARRRDELEAHLPPLLPYPARRQLEALLEQCPALAGVALLSREGRLLGALGMEHWLVAHVGAIIGSLATVGDILGSSGVALYITQKHRLLFTDPGQGLLLLAIPAANANAGEASSQLQRLQLDHFARPAE